MDLDWASSTPPSVRLATARIGDLIDSGDREAAGRLTSDERTDGAAARMARLADQAPASVATSFQLGSREVTSLAKVQTSVTLVTLSALPSMTLPLRSRVAETSWETKRSVIWARLAAQLGSRDLGGVDRHEPGFGGLAARLALADHGFESVIDLARQQILQRPAVALRIGGDDHLIGRARTRR